MPVAAGTSVGLQIVDKLDKHSDNSTVAGGTSVHYDLQS